MQERSPTAMGKTITAVFVGAVTDRDGAFFAVRDRSHTGLMQERSPTAMGKTITAVL
jgi:hypothetical protein